MPFNNFGVFTTTIFMVSASVLCSAGFIRLTVLYSNHQEKVLDGILFLTVYAEMDCVF